MCYKSIKDNKLAALAVVETKKVEQSLSMDDEIESGSLCCLIRLRTICTFVFKN